MNGSGNGTERFDTIIIGGGQSGLVMGYHLQRRGIPFVILDANHQVGHAWRNRWDSLRLFTPGKFDRLSGMRFTGPPNVAPTKDEFADYLEAYANRFQLPVRGRVSVDGLTKRHGRFIVTAGEKTYESERVVVATGSNHVPRVPSFASQLDPRIVQMHSVDYRNPSQLRDGDVLLVGAGNSGADIAMDVVKSHRTWLAGPIRGHVPIRIDGFAARFVVYIVRFLGKHVLTWRTPIGRKVLPKLMSQGTPLVRVKPKDLAAAGVERAPKVTGVKDGLPVLEDGRVLDVANVVWCTGFRHDFSWIDLPVFSADGLPQHTRGIVQPESGMYFVGLAFQYAVASEVIPGVSRDAEYIAKNIAKNIAAARSRQPADPDRVRMAAAG